MRALVTALLMAGTFYVLAPAAQPLPPPSGGAYTQIDCTEYADYARRVAILRSVEAKLELVIQQTRIDAGSLYGIKAQALVREARAVYAERLPPLEARYQAWLRCTAVLGRFGAEA